jgi:hypothetical protein
MKALSKVIASGILGLLSNSIPMTLSLEALVKEATPQKPHTMNIVVIKSTTAKNSLTNLPNGIYYYKEIEARKRVDTSWRMLFSKTGATVIVYSFQGYTDAEGCFKGQQQDHSLFILTSVEKIMGSSIPKYSYPKHKVENFLKGYKPISQLEVIREFLLFPKLLLSFSNCLVLMKNS